MEHPVTTQETATQLDDMAQNESKIHNGTQNTSLEVKLEEEVRLRKFTEDVLDSRQRELEMQEQENAQLKKKMESLKKELAEAQAQLSDARNQSKTKTKQLQDAKDQIFQLQPQRKDITDSEAQDLYKTLVGNVQRWAENRMKPILEDFDAGRLRTRPQPAYASRFASLLKEPAKRCINLDQSDEYHVMAVIMNYIWHAFFAKSFYCPLDDTDGDATLMWIDELENSMSRLPRDAGHCRQWRSETLTALATQNAFKVRRARYLSIITEDLASILSVVVPRASGTELQVSLRRSIIEPAADLAHRLHLAASIYSLKWPARAPWSRLEVYECFNIANGGMILDLTGTSPSSPARRKVSYLFDIAPGLFVERIDGGKKMALKAIHRPCVLVHGGEGDLVQRPTVIRWIWDNASTQSTSREPPRTTAPKRTFGQTSAANGRKR